jgi:hypothetical protein
MWTDSLPRQDMNISMHLLPDVGRQEDVPSQRVDGRAMFGPDELHGLGSQVKSGAVLNSSLLSLLFVVVFLSSQGIFNVHIIRQ